MVNAEPGCLAPTCRKCRVHSCCRTDCGGSLCDESDFVCMLCGCGSRTPHDVTALEALGCFLCCSRSSAGGFMGLASHGKMVWVGTAMAKWSGLVQPWQNGSGWYSHAQKWMHHMLHATYVTWNVPLSVAKLQPVCFCGCAACPGRVAVQILRCYCCCCCCCSQSFWVVHR